MFLLKITLEVEMDNRKILVKRNKTNMEIWF